MPWERTSETTFRILRVVQVPEQIKNSDLNQAQCFIMVPIESMDDHGHDDLHGDQ